MKRILFISIFIGSAILLSLPALLSAGEGSVTWYGPWFNDATTSSSPVYNKTWIQVSNFNNYTANYKITFYQENGSPYSNHTSFTRSVYPHQRDSFRPNMLLNNLSAGEILKGSYRIDAIMGSVSVEETISKVATGITVNGISTGYSNGDILSVWDKPAQTVASTYLNLDYFIMYESNDADIWALSDGEAETFINLNNPFDTDATADLTFYYHYDGDGTQHTTSTRLDFSPHQTYTFRPIDYSINGTSTTSPAKGILLVDVKKGALVGCSAKHYCNASNGTNIYRSYGTLLQKRLNIR